MHRQMSMNELRLIMVMDGVRHCTVLNEGDAQWVRVFDLFGLIREQSADVVAVAQGVGGFIVV
jgi:hypothetical protein